MELGIDEYRGSWKGLRTSSSWLYHEGVGRRQGFQTIATLSLTLPSKHSNVVAMNAMKLGFEKEEIRLVEALIVTGEHGCRNGVS